MFTDRTLQGDHPQPQQAQLQRGPGTSPLRSSSLWRKGLAPRAPAALARPRGSISRASRVPCPAPLTCGSSRGCDKGTAANVLYACLTLMGISSGEGGEGGFCYRDKGRR